MYKEVEKANADKGTKIHGYESLAQENLRKYRTQPRVERKNGIYYIMFRDVEVGHAQEVVSLNTDFDADDRWYFKVQNSTSQKCGVVFVKKENPAKLWMSIKFNYVKIEDANNGWQVLNCYLPDGTVELLWYDGATPEQKSIPE
jgi:Mg2+ and Co2+ transporter CorA